MLTFIKTTHTIIYLLMVAAILFTLYCGIAGIFGWPLYTSLLMVTVEMAVFFGNRMKCPLTTLAREYGAEKGHVFEGYISERLSSRLFRFWGGLFAAGLTLLAYRWFQLP